MRRRLLLGGGGGGGGGSFTPPIDAIGVAAVCAYSFRKVRSAYAGAAMSVTRSSDSTTQDIGFDASGNFNVAAFNTFVGAGSGTINTWYDQSGNAFNITSGVVSPINLTGLNGKPTGVFAGSSRYQVTSGPSSAQPFTMAAVAERTSSFTSTGAIISEWNNNSGIYFMNATNVATIYDSNAAVNIACADSVAHTFIGVLITGGTASLTIDGATTSGLSIGANTASGIVIGGGLAYCNGNISEGMMFASALSAGNISTLAANMKSYWGTP